MSLVFYFPNANSDRARMLKRTLWRRRARGEIGEFKVDYFAGELYLIVEEKDYERVLGLLPRSYLAGAKVRRKGEYGRWVEPLMFGTANGRKLSRATS